jgi:hypothetical protein
MRMERESRGKRALQGVISLEIIWKRKICCEVMEKGEFQNWSEKGSTPSSHKPLTTLTYLKAHFCGRWLFSKSFIIFDEPSLKTSSTHRKNNSFPSKFPPELFTRDQSIQNWKMFHTKCPQIFMKLRSSVGKKRAVETGMRQGSLA